MSEERAQDWKERGLVEYAKLEKDIATVTHKMDTDPELSSLLKKRNDFDTAIGFVQAPFINTIERAREQQAGIKSEFVSRWDIPDKTFKSHIGTVTMRTTRSLQIRSKERLVNFLLKIEKLLEFIKSFDEPKLRKMKDAGLLEDDIASWDEKRSISIRIREAGK